mmetsp:Transcript_30834/g.89672  ORF Transcript_30834/g.89672 Transcript_30834/m.89672 type:complete len:332 (+) Transcript_30834:237-1232(+)
MGIGGSGDTRSRCCNPAAARTTHTACIRPRCALPSPQNPRAAGFPKPQRAGRPKAWAPPAAGGAAAAMPAADAAAAAPPMAAGSHSRLVADALGEAAAAAAAKKRHLIVPATFPLHGAARTCHVELAAAAPLAWTACTFAAVIAAAAPAAPSAAAAARGDALLGGVGPSSARRSRAAHQVNHAIVAPRKPPARSPRERRLRGRAKASQDRGRSNRGHRCRPASPASLGGRKPSRCPSLRTRWRRSPRRLCPAADTRRRPKVTNRQNRSHECPLRRKLPPGPRSCTASARDLRAKRTPWALSSEWSVKTGHCGAQGKGRSDFDKHAASSTLA